MPRLLLLYLSIYRGEGAVFFIISKRILARKRHSITVMILCERGAGVVSASLVFRCCSKVSIKQLWIKRKKKKKKDEEESGGSSEQRQR
jgi:hypothetical protein